MPGEEILWNQSNELLVDDPLGGLGEEPWPQVQVNSGTDDKDVDGGIEE